MDLHGFILHIPYGVLHIEYFRIYIHYKLEEYNHSKLGEVWFNELIEDQFELKTEFESLAEKKVNVSKNFPIFFFVDEWVRYTLRIIPDRLIWLDIPHLINKEEIRVVIGLFSTELVLVLKLIKNKMVIELTSARIDKRDFDS